ncbi:MAG: HAMP domain-containing histidine kinase [Clostridia bacterium]|nr:HAMP domain-containing histidine kinase [Clostridia bacterium]
MKYSIKVKMTWLVAIIIVALIGALLTATLFLAEPFMIHRQKTAIQNLYQSLETMYSDDAEELSRLTAAYEEEKSVLVEIFKEDGTLLYTSGRKMAEGFDGFQGNFQPGRPDGEMMRHEGDYSDDPQVERLGRNEEELLTIRGILHTDAGVRYVSIESPVAAISATVSVLQQLILIIAAIVAMAGCVAAYLYAARFSKPIIAVSNTAKQVAALDFAHCGEEDSSTAEIADLAVSINTMGVQLKSFIDELMAKNRQLAEDNERLAKEEEMRRSFVANVSHDLKSPLAVLGGYAEMLKEHTEGIDPETCYDVIIEETAVMSEMIRSMLDVSALENGIKELKKERFSLSEWLKELMDRERPLLEKKGFTVDTVVAPGLMVDADPEYLERAVLNILQNADNHTVPKGRIAVMLARGEDGLFLSVYNDGVPIPEEKIHKIWDSFYKADEARTRNEQNNVGLGLYIVKTIVTAHGGSCGALNEQSGVRFWLRLPKVCEE